eukprot:c24178_g1_i1 orf=371-1015(+)
MASVIPSTLAHSQAAFLLSASPAVVQEFAKIAGGIILQGNIVGKGYANAANKLQVSVEAVEHGVLMICDIFIRAARSNLSTQQILNLLEDFGFEEAQREVLATHFTGIAKDVRDVSAISTLNVPCYQKLEWRLDVQVASRSLRNQFSPSFLLKFSTSAGDRASLMEGQTRSKAESSVAFLQSNYLTLKAVCSKLEKALAESKSIHSRSVARHFR